MNKENQAEARVSLAIIAILVIGYFLLDVFQKPNSLSSILGGLNLG